MRFDILHVHHRRLAVMANLVSSLTRVPILFTGHLTFPDALWFRELAPSRLTGVSPSVVDYLVRATKAQQVSLVHNPVVFGDLEGSSPALRAARAIAVGRLDPVKGFDTLIEAWSKLKARGNAAQLDIFGEGSLHDALASQIERLDLTGQVKLRGFASNLPELIPEYAFNILVSQKEGFPNAVVEAAAHGRPTLLTDVDGSRDALPPRLKLPNGIPFGNVDILTSTLWEWFDSPHLIEADGRSFHDFLKSRCSPEIVGRQYLAVYAGLTGDPRFHGGHEPATL